MLVVCKNIELLKDLITENFVVGETYSHIEVEHDGEKQHLVYGISMDDETFNKSFDLYAPVIQERVKKLGGKIVIKAEE